MDIWEDTPVVLKREKEIVLPDAPMVYVMASSGLYVVRKHQFFDSCVKTTGGPSELFPQKEYIIPKFPLVPQHLFEQAVGFFEHLTFTENCEAIVLLTWNQVEQKAGLIVPVQVSEVTKSKWTKFRATGDVAYESPTELPPNTIVYGDCHSHCDNSAYSSFVDKNDELHRTGIHIVVGHLKKAPFDFHVEAVVDGFRLKMKIDEAVSGFECPKPFPKEWLDQHAVVEVEPKWDNYGSGRGGGSYWADGDNDAWWRNYTRKKLKQEKKEQEQHKLFGSD